jgi:hypothetical protein
VINLPHVVLNGSVSIKDVFDNLDPLIVRNENEILRTLKKYIDRESFSILLEALVIEGQKKTTFHALLNKRKDGLVVRIHPYSNIEKTSGVKRLIAEIAIQILKIFPNLNIGKTNLQEFLPK